MLSTLASTDAVGGVLPITPFLFAYQMMKTMSPMKPRLGAADGGLRLAPRRGAAAGPVGGHHHTRPELAVGSLAASTPWPLEWRQRVAAPG